jgi:hypothetical protein
METGSATKEPMGERDWMVNAPMNAWEQPSGKPTSLETGAIVTEASGLSDGTIMVRGKDGELLRVSIAELESKATPSWRMGLPK